MLVPELDMTMFRDSAQFGLAIFSYEIAVVVTAMKKGSTLQNFLPMVKSQIIVATFWGFTQTFFVKAEIKVTVTTFRSFT